LKKLINQIMKFSVVGVIAFFIDFGTYTFCNFMGVPYLISGFLGFTISVIFNYILSMHWVFKRRDDISRAREFITFVLLSAVGLVINEVMLYLVISVVTPSWPWLQNTFSVHMIETIAKVIATAVVMVYNFISRKIFLEQH